MSAAIGMSLLAAFAVGLFLLVPFAIAPVVLGAAWWQRRRDLARATPGGRPVVVEHRSPEVAAAAPAAVQTRAA